MTTPRPAELARVGEAVEEAVARLLAGVDQPEGGKPRQILLHINPRTRNVAVVPPDGDIVHISIPRAA